MAKKPDGSPMGVAEVSFATKEEADEACNKYNGQILMGKPMKIVVFAGLLLLFIYLFF